MDLVVPPLPSTRIHNKRLKIHKGSPLGDDCIGTLGDACSRTPNDYDPRVFCSTHRLPRVTQVMVALIEPVLMGLATGQLGHLSTGLVRRGSLRIATNLRDFCELP